jgi:hypothetical protein
MLQRSCVVRKNLKTIFMLPSWFNLCKIRRIIMLQAWTKFLFSYWLHHLANSILPSNHQFQQS